MTGATIIALPLPRRRPVDTPRQAIRAVLMEAVYADLGDGRVALTLPTAVLERLYVAALGEDGA